MRTHLQGCVSTVAPAADGVYCKRMPARQVASKHKWSCARLSHETRGVLPVRVKFSNAGQGDIREPRICKPLRMARYGKMHRRPRHRGPHRASPNLRRPCHAAPPSAGSHTAAGDEAARSTIEEAREFAEKGQTLETALAENEPSISQPQVPTDTGTLAAVLSTCLLISPFFFWGTSMVAMKVRDCR